MSINHWTEKAMPSGSAPEKYDLDDLRNEFNRLRCMVGVLGLTVQRPTNPDDHAISELAWTLDERCEAFAKRLDAFRPQAEG